MVAPTIKLNNGNIMPILGLGTMAANDQTGVQAVKDAIDAGYRLFDTAYVYRNEDAVGLGIRTKISEGIVTRDDVFVTTKLWSSFHGVDKVEGACRMSLKSLGLDYIDLYLMHTPFGSSRDDIDYIDTWRAMENLVNLGLCKNIGISNFNVEQITRLMSVAKIKPVNLQIECNPNLIQMDLINLCSKHGIVVSGYCPLGQPNIYTKSPSFLFDSKIETIGKKYGKTNAQVVLRYLIENGVIPIPKSSNKKRIIENINVFDFKLTPDDMEIIQQFHNNYRICRFEHAINQKYYPF